MYLPWSSDQTAALQILEWIRIWVKARLCHLRARKLGTSEGTACLVQRSMGSEHLPRHLTRGPYLNPQWELWLGLLRPLATFDTCFLALRVQRNQGLYLG